MFAMIVIRFIMSRLLDMRLQKLHLFYNVAFALSFCKPIIPTVLPSTFYCLFFFFFRCCCYFVDVTVDDATESQDFAKMTLLSKTSFYAVSQ